MNVNRSNKVTFDSKMKPFYLVLFLFGVSLITACSNVSPEITILDELLSPSPTPSSSPSLSPSPSPTPPPTLSPSPSPSLSPTPTPDSTPPTITGLSNDSTAKKTVTWNWDCNESPCTYRYSVDTNPSSTFSSGDDYLGISTTSQSSGTGTYYLHVQAKDAAGNESSVVHYSALLDNSAPVKNSFAFLITNPNGNYSSSTNVNLNISAVDTETSSLGMKMCISNDPNCTACTPYVAYSTTYSSWTLPNSNTLNNVYLLLKDSLGNQSACIQSSNSLTHDNVLPSDPTAFTYSSYHNSVSTSPLLAFTNSSDPGGSGILSHYAKIVDSANASTVVKDWTSITSGSTLSGISTLQHGGSYIIQLKSKDYAENESNVVSG